MKTFDEKLNLIRTHIACDLHVPPKLVEDLLWHYETAKGDLLSAKQTSAQLREANNAIHDRAAKEIRNRDERIEKLEAKIRGDTT